MKYSPLRYLLGYVELDCGCAGGELHFFANFSGSNRTNLGLQKVQILTDFEPANGIYGKAMSGVQIDSTDGDALNTVQYSKISLVGVEKEMG